MAGRTAALPRGISGRRGAYRVRVSYLGKQYQVGQFTTLGDAKVALTIARSQIVRGTFTSVPKRRRLREEARQREEAEAVTVSRWADTWLKGLEQAGRSPGTLVAYRSTLTAHALPAMGAMRLSEVTPEVIDALLAGKTDATSYNITRTLSSMFKAAIKADVGGLSQSPVTQAGRYGKTRRPDEQDFATVAEVRAMADAMPERLRLAVWLAFWCGLRLGELLGLQRRDLDLSTADPVLDVRRQWLIKAKPHPRYSEPKAGSARREALPKSLLSGLGDHLERFVSDTPEAPLFASTLNPMRPVSQTSFDRAWKAARDPVRPGFRFHALRHVHLTLYAQAGATSRETMSRGGHTSLEVAQRYQAATAARDRMLIDRMDDTINTATD